MDDTNGPSGSGEPDADIGASDLGRRVRRYRQLLGLSRQELADRAGMAEPFIRHLETDPRAEATSSTVRRLAVALGIEPARLSGADVRPAGHGGPGPSPVLATLSPEQCWTLLRPGGVGRIALDAPGGPLVAPLNFTSAPGTVRLRLRPGTLLRRVLRSDLVTFEVDSIDDVTRSGWSVVVTGTAAVVDEAPDDPDDPDDPDGPDGEHVETVRPWAPSPTQVDVRIHATGITGRRVDGGG